MKKFWLFFAIYLFSIGIVVAETDIPIIPPNVAWMYVFIQNPASIERDSGKEVATMITPDDFLKNFSHYKEMARKDNAKLIVTAETKDHRWVQEQILYKGENLVPARYYNPGIDKAVPGAEIPLD